MSPIRRTGHPSPDEIQDYLEGELSARQEAWVRGHLDVCARCREEVQDWKVLFHDLADLAELAPGDGFSEGVLARLGPAPAPALRGRWWSLGLLRRWEAGRHLSHSAFQEYLEGRLGRRAQARADAHLAACSTCRVKMTAWQRLWRKLAGLEHFAPRPGFADSVLLHLRAQAVESGGSVRYPAAASARWARGAQSLLPLSPRSWAVAGGVAMVPALLVASLAWEIFSHPLVSIEATVTYLTWKASSALAAALAAAGGGPAGNLLLAMLYALFQGATQAPWLIGAGSFFFSASCAGSAWLLYRHLTSPRESHRHAQILS